jgi:hypothetical protein
MQLFLQILTNLANIHDNLKTNKELQQIVAVIGAYIKKRTRFYVRKLSKNMGFFGNMQVALQNIMFYGFLNGILDKINKKVG